ncbi:MAG: HDOD domain-containing protein [Thermodesulforhabdaceae bacterium]
MEALVARQPIFDRNKNLWGYEILYRSTPDATKACINDPDEASFTVLHNLLMVMDFKELIEGTKGFINFTKRLLTEDIATILPPDLTVIEILECTTPDDTILESIKKLKKSGYLLAVDDFALEETHLLPFVEMVDIVKVDLMKTPKSRWNHIVKLCNNKKKLLLAEKVETYEDLKYATELGFDLFQGFFFSRPVTVLRKEIPPAATSMLRIMSELFKKEEMDLKDFENILKKDPALTYKLLRYVNSPAVGLRHPVSDIRRAIMLLGERELRRWLLLVIYGSVSKESPYKLFGKALHRGRYMELLAYETKTAKPDEAFLVGVLSPLDAMLQCPMENVLEQLYLAPPIQKALLSHEGTLGLMYRMIMAHEAGDSEKVVEIAKNFSLDIAKINQLYIEAIRWAQML